MLGFEYHPDDTEARRHHLRKRLMALRGMRAAAELNDRETNFEIPDDALEAHWAKHGIDIGTPEWSKILDARRKRLKDLNADSVMSEPGSSGNDQVNGFTYSGAV